MSSTDRSLQLRSKVHGQFGGWEGQRRSEYMTLLRRPRLVPTVSAVLLSGMVLTAAATSTGAFSQPMSSSTVALDIYCVGAGPVTVTSTPVVPETSRCFPLPDTLQ